MNLAEWVAVTLALVWIASAVYVWLGLLTAPPEPRGCDTCQGRRDWCPCGAYPDPERHTRRWPT